MLGAGEEQEKQSNKEETCKNVELSSPAVLLGDVASDYWAESHGGQSHHVIEHDRLASLMNLKDVSKLEEREEGSTTKYKSPMEERTIDSKGPLPSHSIARAATKLP